MQCGNCGSFIDPNVTKCPTCGATYRKQESVYLGLLRFVGSICLLLGAFTYFSFHNLASAILCGCVGIGVLLLARVLSARAAYRWLGGAKAGQPRDLPNFNSDFCRNTLRIGALICIGIVVTTAILLATSEPGNTRCPGWTQGQLQGWTGSLVIISIWVIWVCFIAFFRWNWFYRRSVDKMMWKWENADSLIGRSINPRDFQANQTFVLISAFSILCSALPLLSMLSNCTTSSGKFTIGF